MFILAIIHFLIILSFIGCFSNFYKVFIVLGIILSVFGIAFIYYVKYKMDKKVNVKKVQNGRFPKSK